MPPRGLSTDENLNVVRTRGLARDPVRVLRIRYRDINEVAWVGSDNSQQPPAVTSVTTGFGAAGASGAGTGERSALSVESGFGTAGGSGSGASQKIAGPYTKVGYATAGSIAAGARQTDHIRSGFATAGGIGAGSEVKTTALIFPSTGVLDNFNRANGALGSNWSPDVTVVAGAPMPSISGNAIVSPAANVIYTARWLGGTFGPDSEVYATINRYLDGDRPRLYARVTDAASSVSDCYQVTFSLSGSTETLDLSRVLDGAATPLYNSSVTPVLQAGDVIGLRVEGAVITVLMSRAGVVSVVAQVTDPAPLPPATNSYVGLRLFNSTTAGLGIDDFGGGTLGAIAGTVYTKAGHGAGGLVAAGPGASVFIESGYATAGGNGYAARVRELKRSCFAVAGGIGAGPSASVFVESGFATVGGVASGPSASVFAETGFALVGTVSAGASSRQGVQVKAGAATAGGVGSGPSASVFGRAGLALVGLVAAGTRARLLSRAGAGLAAGAATGLRERLRLRSGTGATGTVGAGSSASVFAETGTATAGLVAAGSSTHVFGGNVKSGAAAAGLTARGARSAEHGCSGAAIAGLTALGVRRVVYVEAGVALVEGTGSGLRTLEHGLAGWAAVGMFGSGHEFLPGREPLPPGQIAPPIVGRIEAGLLPEIDRARSGYSLGPQGGLIAVGEGGSNG